MAGTNAVEPLALRASAADKRAHYADTARRIASLLEGEDDWVAAMATVACELGRSLANDGSWPVWYPGVEYGAARAATDAERTSAK